MNKKLLNVLQAKCKDFGLSEKAIEDLATLGSEGITDETPEEDITKKADSLVPFAKQMQAEVTRKAQRKANRTETTEEPAATTEETAKGGNTGAEDEPEWFKHYKAEQEKKLTKLENENAAMKLEKSKAERGAAIASKARELGIPDFLMKRFSLDEKADIEKELTEYKQELVTNKLMPQDAASILTSSDYAMNNEARAFASKQPDKKMSNN